jgi:hypothetical protein
MARHLRVQTLSNLPSNSEGQLGRCRQFFGDEKPLSLLPNKFDGEPARITARAIRSTSLFAKLPFGLSHSNPHGCRLQHWTVQGPKSIRSGRTCEHGGQPIGPLVSQNPHGRPTRLDDAPAPPLKILPSLTGRELQPMRCWSALRVAARFAKCNIKPTDYQNHPTYNAIRLTHGAAFHLRAIVL